MMGPPIGMCDPAVNADAEHMEANLLPWNAAIRLQARMLLSGRFAGDKSEVIYGEDY
jgi:hypothetical protein